jgi:hypothetical protein
MKILKIILATLILSSSFNLISQINVTTQNTSSPASCDGSACFDSTAMNFINATSIYWAGSGAILQQGGYCIFNLCSGTYTVTYTVNGTSTTSTFAIGSGSGNPCNGFTANISIQPASTAVSCDGAASCSGFGGTAPYAYYWSTGEATSTTMSYLCSGYNVCCSVSDANGCITTVCDSVTNQGQTSGGGDTLLFSGSGCNNPVGNVFMQVEDCNFDFNAVDTAYLSSVIQGVNPADSSVLFWVFVDTNGVSNTIQTFAPAFNAIGCYNFTLMLFCSQKSMNVKTIIVSDQYMNQSSGIELIKQTDKKVVKIIDLSGREVLNENAKGVLIYHFSDGTIQKVFVW